MWSAIVTMPVKLSCIVIVNFIWSYIIYSNIFFNIPFCG